MDESIARLARKFSKARPASSGSSKLTALAPRAFSMSKTTNLLRGMMVPEITAAPSAALVASAQIIILRQYPFAKANVLFRVLSQATAEREGPSPATAGARNPSLEKDVCLKAMNCCFLSFYAIISSR